MAAAERDDKALRDVKAVLHGLQRIGAHRPQAEAASDPPGDGAATDKRPVQGKRLAAFALAMLAAGTVIVLAGDLFVRYWPSSPPSMPANATRRDVTSPVAATERAGARTSAPRQSAPQAPPVNNRVGSSAVTTVPPNLTNAITNAHELMDGGHIVAAREVLQQPDLAASQEGAWLLARSYDPNYLATIQSPDASADPRQAEEWYRRWREIAARDGMVMDDLHFKRIIDSMR
jgi:hypothetical protein